jgi:molybdopterin-guanine dinucleotide biosynthesis adapter protein
MAPPIVSIVSKKGSGKTTLLERLIPELRRRGYRTGTVKHDTHGFDIDHEGKDTWRHKQSGAATVVISSPWKLSLIKDVDHELDLDQIVAAYFSDVDLVLTEGFSRAGKPQVEVFRRTAHAEPLHKKGAPNHLVAVMSDTPVDLDAPNFDIDAVADLADLIVKRFLTARGD